jgi:phosphoribosylamine--glycine ligase/phosphoribosylformylglycinamidine cyclo-ligase
MNKHDTIGIDLVAMNVNDLVCQGAEPLLFLDYFACGKLDVDVACDVVKGVAHGCAEAGAALVGGETAEMPGMYQHGDYDLAGFTVGAAERTNLLPRMNEIVSGDIVLGIPSSGVHSNGYSLVRHLMNKNGIDYHSPCPFEPSKPVGHVLLTPTRIYVKQLLPLVQKQNVKAMAHITGGGLLENIPRVIPDSVKVKLDASQWPLLPVFKWMKQLGNISPEELSRTFNCGIGMMLVVSPEKVEEVSDILRKQGETVYKIGNIVNKSEIPGEHAVLVENTQAW